jgi:hypothetical protein
MHRECRPPTSTPQHILSLTSESSSDLNSNDKQNYGTKTGSDSELNILALQVRAFFNASEDVEIDPETVEDLMKAISDYKLEDENRNADGGSTAESRNDINGDVDTDDEAELDISALYSFGDEGDEEDEGNEFCCVSQTREYEK